jgi:hypothetical protein
VLEKEGDIDGIEGVEGFFGLHAHAEGRKKASQGMKW